MKEIEEMLKLLNENQDANTFYNNDNDLDFDEVMMFCCEDAKPHKLRFPDGTEGYLLFEE